jgi:hypothetical protein
MIPAPEYPEDAGALHPQQVPLTFAVLPSTFNEQRKLEHADGTPVEHNNSLQNLVCAM